MGLVLTRKANEMILIGDTIQVHVVSIGSGEVRLRIDAPRSVRILRAELAELAELDKTNEPDVESG